MTGMSDQPVFHMTPREVMDLYNAGCRKGYSEAEGLGPVRFRKNALIDVLVIHAMHLRHEAGDTVYDRDELRRAIEAMFEGVEPR